VFLDSRFDALLIVKACSKSLLTKSSIIIIMFKFNYNVFKSNCNALSKQFNQVRSTCVVYHDLCQESVVGPIEAHGSCSTGIPDDDDGALCSSHNCSEGQHKLQPNHASNASHQHLHHHNHEHGLVYSKRVRSILLLNALFSAPPNAATSSPNVVSSGRVSPAGLSNTSALSCTWNSCAEQIRHYSKKVGKDKKIGKGKNTKSAPKVQLNDEEMNSVIDVEELHVTMDRLVDSLRQDLVANINLRMGKNIDELTVKLDEQTFQLRELAQISRKNANLLCLNLSNCPGKRRSFMILPYLSTLAESLEINVNCFFGRRNQADFECNQRIRHLH
jgi:hypothetical protein